MSLSRCGRRYPTFDAALLAAELRTSKGAKPLAVVSCDVCTWWHLKSPKDVAGQRYRPDPFPPVVAKMITRRDDDGLCQRCGSSGRTERHHRRLKASGGSKARSHTQCACNGISLCRSCHEWVHREVGQARDLGLIVRQAAALPARVSVLRYALDSDRDRFWARCDGTWAHSPADVED